MSQIGSVISVIDNSGVKTIKCIKILGGFKPRYAKLGCLVSVVVKQLRSQTASGTIIEDTDEEKDDSNLRRGEKLYGLIVQSKLKPKNLLGFYTFFLSTSVVLFDANKTLKGTRILGLLPKQLRATRYMRLITLSSGTC